jgi:hypothetical protein
MRSSTWITALAGAVISTACATTSPLPPSRQLAETRASVRVAEEVGAATDPRAVPYLTYARQQMAEADYNIAVGNYRAAERSLLLAQADAELAAALGRESSARAEAQAIRRQVDELKARVPQ